MLLDQAVRRRCVEHGFMRARQFDIHQHVTEISNVYDEILRTPIGNFG
jgi:hypothetical protein